MKPQTTSQIINTIKVIALALLLALGISYVSAQWSGPTAVPPNNNVSAPINVGSADQTKTGKLGVGSLVVGVGGSIISPNTLSSYGSTTIQGSKNGWSGINFRDSAGANSGTLMMSPTYSGFYNGADSAWRFYVDNAGNTIQLGTATIAGTATVGGLKIATGAGAGKVLTSSADGTGTWQTAAGGGGGIGTINNRPIGTTVGASVQSMTNNGYTDFVLDGNYFMPFGTQFAPGVATGSIYVAEPGTNGMPVGWTTFKLAIVISSWSVPGSYIIYRGAMPINGANAVGTWAVTGGGMSLQRIL